MPHPEAQLIDISAIAPKDGEATIIAALDALPVAASLTVQNLDDCDALLRSLRHLRPNEIRWEGRDNDQHLGQITFTKTVTVLDVRPIIDAGGEPFETIMEAVGNLGDEPLVIVAPFEPTPLEGVLSSQGFAFDANEVEPGHWRTRFSAEQ